MKMAKGLKNGIRILLGQAEFLNYDQNSQNIVLISNSETAWPT